MRAYLSENPSCGDAIVTKFDALSKSPTTQPYAIELYKYCTLYISGGVYLDADVKFLVDMQDVLKWERDAEANNYAVLSDSANSGVEYTFETSDIALPITKSSSYQGIDEVSQHSIITTPVLAVPKPESGVMKKMLELIEKTSVKSLEEEALLLPKALMGYVRQEEKKWIFFRQRCHGVVVAGGEER